MGKRGPKSRGQAKGREAAVLVLHPEVVAVAADDSSGIPAPPAGIESAAVLEAWAEYWSSTVARAADTVDLPAIRRLFVYRDEWERAMDGYRKARLVEGSMGQPRLSPFAAQLTTLEGMIAKLENELGLTPYSRSRLGLAIGQARQTVADLNAAAAVSAKPGKEDRGDDPKSRHPSKQRRRTKAPLVEDAGGTNEEAELDGWEEA